MKPPKPVKLILGRWLWPVWLRKMEEVIAYVETNGKNRTLHGYSITSLIFEASVFVFKEESDINVRKRIYHYLRNKRIGDWAPVAQEETVEEEEEGEKEQEGLDDSNATRPASSTDELASESDDGDTDKVAGSDSSFVIPSTSDSEHGDTLPRQKGKCVAAQVPAHAPRQPAPRRQPAVPAVHTHPLAKMNADLKKTVQELQREIATQKNGIVKLNKLNEELRAQMKRERDAKKLVLKRNFKLQRECNDAKKIITRLQSNITNFMDMVKLAENQYLVA